MAADLWEMQENQYVSEILIDKLEFVILFQNQYSGGF